MDKFENQQNLLDALRGGNSDAWKYMYKKGFEIALNKIRVSEKIRDTDRADEITQIAIIKLFKQIRKDKVVPKNLIGLLRRIIESTYIDSFKGKKTVELTENHRETFFISEEDDLKLLKMILTESLEKLKEDCREFLKDYYYTIMKLKEVADLWGLSEAFAKLKNHRCKKYLEEIIKNHPDFKNL